MKQCSKCLQTYPDDDLNFCLLDGTTLVSLSDSSFEETVIRPSPLVQLTPQQAKQGVSPLFAYSLIALLALIVGGGIVFFLRPSSEVSSNSPTKVENSPAKTENSSTKVENPPPSPTPILEKMLDIKGMWVGKYSGKSATLVFKQTDKNKYSGTLSRTTFEIAIDAYIVPDARQVFFDEKNVIKGKSWGTLGTSRGSISTDGKSMTGGGQDEHGVAYSWSFSKQ